MLLYKYCSSFSATENNHTHKTEICPLKRFWLLNIFFNNLSIGMWILPMFPYIRTIKYFRNQIVTWNINIFLTPCILVVFANIFNHFNRQDILFPLFNSFKHFFKLNSMLFFTIDKPLGTLYLSGKTVIKRLTGYTPISFIGTPVSFKYFYWVTDLFSHLRFCFYLHYLK